MCSETERRPDGTVCIRGRCAPVPGVPTLARHRSLPRTSAAPLCLTSVAGDEVTNPRRLVLEGFRVVERRQLTERGALLLGAPQLPRRQAAKVEMEQIHVACGAIMCELQLVLHLAGPDPLPRKSRRARRPPLSACQSI